MEKEIRILQNEDSEVRIVGDSRKIEGYGIVFNKESRDLGGFTEVILPQAVDGVIERSDILALLNHDVQKGVLARSTKGDGTLKLKVDKRGVKYSFEAPRFDLGDELIEGVKRGDIKGSSFAFSVPKEGWGRWEDREGGSLLRVIEKFDNIYDMSPCYREAYPDTSVALRSLESRTGEVVFEEVTQTDETIEEKIKVEEEVKDEADVKPDVEETTPEPITEEKSEPEAEQRNINENTNKKMTLVELKDARAKCIEQNEKIMEAKRAENRIMTEKEESIVAHNNQLMKEYDLEIETEERKAGKGVLVGPYINIIKEKEPFSLIKAIRARVENREMPPAARELNLWGRNEFITSGINPRGDILIPSSVERRADILAGAATQGQEIVAEDKKAILPPLEDKLIFSQAGATFMTGLVGNVSIPSYAGTAVAWKTEVEAATDGAGLFGEVEFSPKRLTGYIDVSKTFLAQDGVGAERLLLDNIAGAVARKLESTILGVAAGNSTQPQGMGYKITTGEDTKANSVVPTYAALIALESTVDTSNALVGNLAYITNAGGRGILKSIDKGTSNDTGDYLCSETNIVNGYPLLVTNSASAIAGDDETGDLLVFGNWKDLGIAQWGGYDITVDPYSLAITNKVRIVINAYFDAKGLRGTALTDLHGGLSDPDDYAVSFSSISLKLS